MSGNVLEWCWDWWSKSYANSSENATDPKGADSGAGRVARGGALIFDTEDCTVTARGYNDSYSGEYFNGFRVVRSAQ